jgi:hypothetical protein
MRCVTSRLQRAVARLLASSPNYVEITALLATALAARVLFSPAFWKVSPQACVAVALFVSILVYACVDCGQIFAYFGWVHPRRRTFWLYALIAGAAAATLVIAILHAPLGHSSPATLLYGVTIGPIIEEILFRGVAFSAIYVTAASIKGLLDYGSQWRLSSLPCSSRSLTRERWEFRGLCSSAWARCMRSCGGDPIQPRSQLSCTLHTTQLLHWRCFMLSSI